jgi:predicted ribonuclease YlaK
LRTGSNTTRASTSSTSHQDVLGEQTNDDDILEDIRYAFANASRYFGNMEPVVVSNDRMFRVRLGCDGIKSQEYKDSKPFQSLSQLYTGFAGCDDEKSPTASGGTSSTGSGSRGPARRWTTSTPRGR